MSGEPYTKAQQLARPVRRYRRKVAGPKRWQALHDEKQGPCRVCGADRLDRNELHHLIPRDRFGDDVADNLVPICPDCHAGIHNRNKAHVVALLSGLTDAEYAYAIDKGGEGVFERVYGIEYQRV